MSLVLVEPVPCSAGASSTFTLGVEEELFLVDPVSLLPAAYDCSLLAQGRFVRGVIAEEMCDGVIELATPICDSAAPAAATLAALRREVLSRQSGSLVGVGVHPTAGFGQVRHRQSPHYDEVSRDTPRLGLRS